MDIANYTSSLNKSIEDPRTKSSKYFKGSRVEFDKDEYDFAFTQFLIDSNYIGEPPHVQVSIDNLNDNIDENFLKKDLCKFGALRSLEIIRHPHTGQHLGLAKVQFEDVLVAKSCIESFNGKHIMGNQLKVFLDIRFAIIEKLKSEKLNPPQPPAQQSRPSLGDRIAILLRQPNSILSSMSGPQSTPSLTSTPSIYSNSPHPSALLTPQHLQRPNNHSNHNNESKSNDDHKSYDEKYKSYDERYKSYDNKYKSYDDKFKSYDDKYKSYDERRKSDEQSIKEPDEVEKSPEIDELSEEQVDNEVIPYCFNKFVDELKTNLLSTILKRLKEAYGFDLLERAQTEFRRKEDQKRIEKDKERHERDLQKQYEYRYQAHLSRARSDTIKTDMNRQKVNVSRHRQDTNAQEETRRVNRSSAFCNEPDRRGTSIDSDLSDIESHSTSRSSSAQTSRSSSCESHSSTYSSSGSRSSSPVSDFSDDSVSDRTKGRKSRKSEYDSKEGQTITVGSTKVIDYSSDRHRTSQDDRTDAEQIALNALLCISSSDPSQELSDIKTSKQSRHNKPTKTSKESDMDDDSFIDDDYDEDFVISKRSSKQSSAKKRKMKSSKTGNQRIHGVASEYRSAKRFASDSTKYTDTQIYNGDENAMLVDENLSDSKPEMKYMFPERSPESQRSMLDNLRGTLDVEDIEYLKQIHEQEYKNTNNGIKDGMPFGSYEANTAHLISSKKMIEVKSAGAHPKWWRGCSRCDPIDIKEKSVKGRNESDDEDEENKEDAQNAPPIKSNVIQATTSSRREGRGDQRRIAVLNPELDAAFLKLLTTNTLQMRAKNLRFSKSKIHMWGLFACEKIASGDAVIEYVGEKIRPSLADHREKVIYTNLPSHDGSSYFFRVDTDVIDATLKGNKARFINHCCNPNCIAKVIKHDNGSNSIVIYAKQPIQEDEEITYDYKFPIEETENKIQCKCGAPNCRKTLN